MQETPGLSPATSSPPASPPELRARLETVARRLEEAGSLDSESQRVLAELVDELSQALEAGNLPEAEIEHLAEITAHVEESLRHQHDTSLLAKTRESLDRAVTNAEAHAPIAVGMARRLLDALANIGI